MEENKDTFPDDLLDFCYRQILRIINLEPANRTRPWQAQHVSGRRKPSLTEQDSFNPRSRDE